MTLAGHPAVCLPVGLDEEGMPFGLQIVGPRGGDAFVLGVAAALEEALAGSAALRRPAPDLDRLRAAAPISSMEGFLGWGRGWLRGVIVSAPSCSRRDHSGSRGQIGRRTLR